MKKIAIMQPTFLPWIGYLAMIESVDEFVFLDSVQFAKRSWQQRNRIKTSQGELMLTVPVFSKGKQDQLIYEVEINREDSSFRKLASTISNNYSKAPYYKLYSEQFFSILQNSGSKIVDLNVGLIKFFMEVLEISHGKLSYSKDLPFDSKKADLLAEICEARGANLYLSAPGSRTYIEESGIFEKKNIEVIYHDYNHPTYAQLYGNFLPFMGAVDLIFNMGPQSREVMLAGLRH